MLFFIFVKLFQLDYYTGHEEEEEEEEYVKGDDFRCLLYPTNALNCSWSFPTLPEDTQLVVNIRYFSTIIYIV